nr:cysteine desulfurase [Lachnospiraceae bacterium]
MKDYKQEFPLLKNRDIAYLDNAATEQRPQAVLDAVEEFYQKHNANPLRGLYDLAVEATDAYEAARETVARFLNAPKASQIIFTRNTTESINLVAYSYALGHLQPGDEILTTVMEHHSNLLPWQMVAKKTGAKVVYLEPEKDGTITRAMLEKAVNEHTKFAAMAQVSNVLGCINPVEDLIELVHAQGGIVLIDAAQSAPHMAIDVQAMNPDFLAFSGHKLMAPMGIGVLYGRMELLEEMEPFMSGGEMIESVTLDGAVYAEVPHKFEAGTVNAGGAVGLAAAIDYLNAIGFDEITKREDQLTQMIFDGIAKIPHVTIQGSKDPMNHHGIMSFAVEGVHPHDVATILSDAHVAVRAGHHCAQPLLKFLGVRSTARVSLAFYNDETDVKRFL